MMCRKNELAVSVVAASTVTAVLEGFGGVKCRREGYGGFIAKLEGFGGV